MDRHVEVDEEDTRVEAVPVRDGRQRLRWSNHPLQISGDDELPPLIRGFRLLMTGRSIMLLAIMESASHPAAGQGSSENQLCCS